MSFGGAPLWADGMLTLRVRGSGFGAGRPLTIRRPFALLGRGEGCDIRIDDPTVSARHAYLHIDRRGIFVVDLATRSGMRLDDAPASSGWLRPGQALEVAGRRVEIVSAHVDGVSSFAGPAPASLLAESGDAPLARLSLRNEEASDAPWSVNSELLFVGRSPSCGVRVAGDAARIHAVLVRREDAAYLVDLSGRGMVLNGQPIQGATPLADGDRLRIGATRFTVQVAPPARGDDAGGEDEEAGPPSHILSDLRRRPRRATSCPCSGSPTLRALPGPIPAIQPTAMVPQTDILPAELLPPGFPAGDTQATAMLGWMIGVLQATQGEMMRRQDDFQREVVDALRQMHQDNQEAMSGHHKKVDRIQSELSALREEIRQRFGRPPPRPPSPLRPPASPSRPPARRPPSPGRFRGGGLVAPEPGQPARRREPLLVARAALPDLQRPEVVVRRALWMESIRFRVPLALPVPAVITLGEQDTGGASGTRRWQEGCTGLDWFKLV